MPDPSSPMDRVELDAGGPAGASTQRPGVAWWRPAPSDWRTSSAGAVVDPPNSLPFFALLLFTSLLILSPQSFFPALLPLRLQFVGGCLAIGSYVLHCFLQGRPLTIRVRELTLLTALVAWALVTLPLSLWPGGSVDTLVNFYSKSLAICFLIINLVVTPARLRRMAWLFTLLSIPVAITAVANFHAGTYIPESINARIMGYQAVATEDPNDLALFLNFTLPLSGGLLPGERRGIVRVMLILVILCDIAAIIATFSRSGFVGLATITSIFLWKMARKRGGWVAALVIVAAIIVVPLLPAGYLQRIGTSVDIDADTTNSAAARWELAKGAVAYLARHPLVGAGIGAGILALNDQIGSQWHQVHSAYLEYALELGLPGLLLFLALLGSAFNGMRLARRRLRAAGAPPALLSLHNGIELSLIAFAMGALFLPCAYGWVTHYALGMAVAARLAMTNWCTAVTGRRYRERTL